jgi:hypothetical protein
MSDATPNTVDLFEIIRHERPVAHSQKTLWAKSQRSMSTVISMSSG